MAVETVAKVSLAPRQDFETGDPLVPETATVLNVGLGSLQPNVPRTRVAALHPPGGEGGFSLGTGAVVPPVPVQSRSPNLELDVNGVPQEVRQRMLELGMRVARHPTYGLVLVGSGDVPLAGLSFGGTATTLSGTVAPNGGVVFNATHGDIGTSIIAIDNETRAVTTTHDIRGERHVLTGYLPYSGGELRSLWDRLTDEDHPDPDAERVATLRTIEGTEIASFKQLFAAIPPDAREGALHGLQYAQMRQALGAERDGVTVDGFRAFVGPGDGPAAVAARDKELSRQVLFYWQSLALLASRPPSETDPNPDDLRRFRTELRDGNWFRNFPQRVGLRIHTNQQVNELVSDAASLATLPTDIHRIAINATSPLITESHGSYASAQYARQVILEVTRQRIGPAKLEKIFANAGAAAELATALDLSAGELLQIQRTYMSVGAALVGHLKSELATRYAPHPERR
jgi:hypothetical protein